MQLRFMFTLLADDLVPSVVRTRILSGILLRQLRDLLRQTLHCVAGYFRRTLLSPQSQPPPSISVQLQDLSERVACRGRVPGPIMSEGICGRICHLLRVQVLLAAFSSVAVAQLITPTPACADVDDATYPMPPLTYPMPSNRYSVQYKLDSGAWTDATVYISYYGGTNASPYRNSSNYAPDTSMSFTSIPAAANAAVSLRVTKLWGSDFPTIDQMSVRPGAKGIQVVSDTGNVVEISTNTSADFAGEQFLLWWAGDTTESSTIQSLVFFLNPPYSEPTGGNVLVVMDPAQLNGDLSHVDTLDFEGSITIGTTGAVAFPVPANIKNIFLGPGAWVQGKLRFVQGGDGSVRRLYGPGVLDVSRFEYDLRTCGANSGYAEQGYNALSWVEPPGKSGPDTFLVDGIVITDHNHAVADPLLNGSVNNVNTLGWNGINGGFRIGNGAKVSNLFIRAGDDSLMMWGAFITVTNITVWQNYNGGVVNLGWSDDSPGDYSLIDSLYVVKTDWNGPTNPSWSATNLNGQNDAVVASLMTPGTMFGSVQPSLYRNIYIDDPPQTLFSLKITFPECNDPDSPRYGDCKQVDLTQSSLVNLYIENVVTPHIPGQDAIGFQTLPPGITDGQNFPSGYTLTGSINIGLTNVTIAKGDGTVKQLNAADAVSVGKITTGNGSGINIIYTNSPSGIVFSASPNPSTAGQSITLSSTVSPAGATGSVSFLDGASSLGSVNLSAGVATLTLNTLAAGNHSLAAFYSGDINYDPNVSAAIGLPVFSLCDVSRDGSTGVTDVQLMINEVLGVAPPANDLNADGVINVVDLQIVTNAAVGLACAAR